MNEEEGEIMKGLLVVTLVFRRWYLLFSRKLSWALGSAVRGKP